MNELIFSNPFANMFREIEAMMDFDLTKSRGLKKIISRPHNLITKKNEKGEIESFILEVVYTPFAKSDVKVETLKNQLTVKCGSENKVKDEDMDYCGISHQSYEFTIPLSNIVDTKAITAKAEDGILKIVLPVKKIEEQKELPTSIEIV